MTFEQAITDLLNPLVAVGHVFWDTVPDGFVVTTPVIIIQQVGGKAGWYVDQTYPSHQHARVQIMVWARRRLDASPLARVVEKAIADSTMIAEPYGAPVGLHQEEMKLHGTQQDFGFWFNNP